MKRTAKKVHPTAQHLDCFAARKAEVCGPTGPHLTPVTYTNITVSINIF